MSVELRITCDGGYRCARPMSIGSGILPCPHDVVCDWGVFSNSDPDRDPFGKAPEHLILITPCCVAGLEKSSAERNGATSSVTRDGDRVFVHLERLDGKRWTWELFEAHWQDGQGGDIFVGRWPD